MARVSIAIRTKRKHPYFFISSDKSPMYVVQVDGKTVEVVYTKRQAIKLAKKYRNK